MLRQGLEKNSESSKYVRRQRMRWRGVLRGQEAGSAGKGLWFSTPLNQTFEVTGSASLVGKRAKRMRVFTRVDAR